MTNLKNDIGNYLIEQTLQDVGSARSPVTGRSFKDLSKKYKKLKSKLASPIPNLELKGDMLDAYKFKKTSDGIEIGIFNRKQAQKADNHNKFSSESLETKVPARPFIPKEGRDNYRPDIRKEISRIIQGYQTEEESLSLNSIASKLIALNKPEEE